MRFGDFRSVLSAGKDFPIRRRAKRERDAARRNKKRRRDLRRRGFEVETRLVAGRSGAAKSFPAERTYLSRTTSADLSRIRVLL